MLVTALPLVVFFGGASLVRNAAAVITIRMLMPGAVPEMGTGQAAQLRNVFQSLVGGSRSDSADRIHLALGLLDDHAGNHEAAVTEWQLAGSEELWLHLASQALRRGRPIDAIQFYERAIAVDPTRPQNYFALASVYWPVLDDPKNSGDVYAQILELVEPGSLAAHRARGYVFLLSGDWPRTLDEFEAALNLRPADIDSARQASRAAEALGATDRAVHHLVSAAKHIPGDTWTATWLNIEAGDVSFRAGRLADAAAWYNAAAQIDATHPALGPRRAALASAAQPE